MPSVFKTQKGGIISDVIIDSVRTRKLVKTSTDGTKVLIVTDDFTKTGQLIYEVDLMLIKPSEPNKDSQKTFDQILSTFQFLD